MLAAVGDKREERRVFKRFPARFPVRFLDLKQGKEVKAQASDVSAKGLSFVSEGPVERHTPLKLWLHIPDRKKPFCTQGRVAWVESIKVCPSPSKARDDFPYGAARKSETFKVGVNLDDVELMGLSRLLRT